MGASQDPRQHAGQNTRSLGRERGGKGAAWGGDEDGLTGDSRAIAELDRVPDHGTVCDGQEGLGILIWIGREGRKRRSRAAEYESLQARRGHGHRVWHTAKMSFDEPGGAGLQVTRQQGRGV